jgi:triacylglycerol lipase
LLQQFNVSALKCSFFLWILTLPLVVSPPSRSPAGAQNSTPVDFNLICQAAQLASHAYDKKSKILVRYGARITRVATLGKTNVQYILLHDHQRRTQIIAVRGTVDDTNWKLDRYKRIVRDDRAGVLLHRGFRRAADTIFQDIKPRLKPDYTTYLTGHFLGGAVAAILGIYTKGNNY